MNKKGGALMAIGIIVIAIIVIVALVGIYLYNFHTFKTLRLCISEEKEDTLVECSTQQECIDQFGNTLQLQELKDNTPSFVSEKLDEVISKSISCEGTCKTAGLGENFMDQEKLERESCPAGDEEVVMKIKGKDGLEIYNHMKENAE